MMIFVVRRVFFLLKMSQHSINFLLITPELFQIILINVLLLFAICFSFEKGDSASQKVQHDGFQFHGNSYPTVGNTCISNGLPAHTRIPFQAYLITPTLQVEVITSFTILCLTCCCFLYVNNPLDYALGLTECVIWDNLGCLASILVCLSACAALGLGMGNNKRFSRYEFIFITWLSIIGMLCLIKSYNFLALYLSVELQSLSFYMLAAMRSKTEASAEAGLKYFILSAFSSAILLLGISLIYGAIGSQNFADLSVSLAHLTQNVSLVFAESPDNPAITSLPYVHCSYDGYTPVLYVGLGCVCISLLFKLAAAPFHAWVADVYEGSPTAVTAFFAITSKIAAITALIRLIDISSNSLIVPLSFVALISLITGSLSAMRQVKLKRLLAFSGVANVGWLLLALIAGKWDVLVIHLVVYILLSVSLFSVFVLPLFRTHPSLEYRVRSPHRKTTHPYAYATYGSVDHGTDGLTIKYISDLHQIYKTNPSVALAVTIAMFSLGGIPPLAGFYSKYLILSAVTQAEQYLLLFISIGAAVVSVFYYIRVIKTIYFSDSIDFKDEPRLHWFSINTLAVGPNVYICAVCTALTGLFFVKPDYICVWVAMY